MMKVLILLGAALLLGCAEVETLEELEMNAIATGDWSAVYARERQEAKRAARRASSCPAGSINVCENRAGDKRCHCESDESVRDFLNRL